LRLPSIALLLMEELATVTICHHGTRNLAMHTRRAEALFVAVGKAGLITGEWWNQERPSLTSASIVCLHRSR
jgi:5,10-methylene-tetrahydrofolate dehydrogenase/methenyl tetrahydrofolate cyclohydrolase